MFVISGFEGPLHSMSTKTYGHRCDRVSKISLTGALRHKEEYLSDLSHQKKETDTTPLLKGANLIVGVHLCGRSTLMNAC